MIGHGIRFRRNVLGMWFMFWGSVLRVKSLDSASDVDYNGDNHIVEILP